MPWANWLLPPPTQTGNACPMRCPASPRLRHYRPHHAPSQRASCPVSYHPRGALSLPPFAGDPERFLRKFQADPSADPSDLIVARLGDPQQQQPGDQAGGSALPSGDNTAAIAAAAAAGTASVGDTVAPAGTAGPDTASPGGGSGPLAATVRVFRRAVRLLPPPHGARSAADSRSAEATGPAGLYVPLGGLGEVCSHPHHRGRGLAGRTLIAAAARCEGRGGLGSTHTSSGFGPLMALHAASEASALYARLGFAHVSVAKCPIIVASPGAVARIDVCRPADTPSSTVPDSARPIALLSPRETAELTSSGIAADASTAPAGYPSIVVRSAVHGSVDDSSASWSTSVSASAVAASGSGWRVRRATVDDVPVLAALRERMSDSERLVGVHERSAEHWRRYVMGWRCPAGVMVLEVPANRLAGQDHGGSDHGWTARGFAIGLCKRGRASIGELAITTPSPAHLRQDSVEAAMPIASTTSTTATATETENTQEAVPAAGLARLVSDAVMSAVATDPAAAAAAAEAGFVVAASPLAACRALIRTADPSSEEPVEVPAVSDGGWMYRPLSGFAADAAAALRRGPSPVPKGAGGQSCGQSPGRASSSDPAEDGDGGRGPPSIDQVAAGQASMAAIRFAEAECRHVVWDIDGF